MAATDLRYVSLVTGQGYSQPRLMLATPSGRIREIPLNEKEMANLLLATSQYAASKMRTGEEA